MTPQEDREVGPIISRLMAEADEYREFSLLYGRPPEDGEIADIRMENVARCGLLAIRPGFWSMVRYWVAS